MPSRTLHLDKLIIASPAWQERLESPNVEKPFPLTHNDISSILTPYKQGIFVTDYLATDLIYRYGGRVYG